MAAGWRALLERLVKAGSGEVRASMALFAPGSVIRCPRALFTTLFEGRPQRTQIDGGQGHRLDLPTLSDQPHRIKYRKRAT